MGFIKTTKLPTIYHCPPTNQPTDYQLMGNVMIKKFITNLKWITDKKRHVVVVMNVILILWVNIFLLK